MFTGQEVDLETENQNQVKEKGIVVNCIFLELTMCLYSDSGFHKLGCRVYGLS
jgi:hypothetical protein